MSDFGLSIHAQYANITDPELDSLVSDIQHEFPMCGNGQMQEDIMYSKSVLESHNVEWSYNTFTCP